MEHLKGLNSAQKEAVCTIDGPVLVLAGAGAGKTKTIAHRIVHIVNGGVPAHAILAITFTNKAAREMRERVLHLLDTFGGNHTGAPTVATFHALSAMLLREHAEVIGLPKHFTIFDRADSLRAVKRALKQAGEDDKRFEPRTVLGSISRAKSDAKPLSVYREETGNAWYETTVAQVWHHYELIVRKEGAVDFDDLLLLCWRLLRDHADIRERLQTRYQYIHVDEYQDTNKVQYEIVRLLAGERANVFAVGDLDQNVYSWRGATIENILEFERAFPQSTTIRLEQNYRSTKTIVDVSNEIIKKNRRRKEKTLFTDNPEGEKLTLTVAYDERDEAERVVERVALLGAQGVPAREIAILYRANYQSRILEEAFLTAGIPYRVLGTRFFDRKEVKDLLSYIRAGLNPDSWSDIGRIINVPTRGVGKVTYDKLLSGARGTLSGKTKDRVDEFFVILRSIGAYAGEHTTSELLLFALTRSGLEASLQGTSEEDVERLENVRELVSLAVNRYDALGPEGILRLLEDSALATDQDELDQRTDRTKGDAVTLMTVHAAKGLEFAHVFITGLEDGLFPHERMDEKGTADTEEERRLFYVALTRAKDQIHLSYAQTRTVFGQRLTRMPSEFVLDIDAEYIEGEEMGGGQGGQGGGKGERVVYLD